MKNVFFGVLAVLSLIFLAGCGEKESVSGGLTYKISTLTIFVHDENGLALEGASVYVEGVHKGTTSKYGQKGTKKVVLSGDENWIWVEKEGYVSSSPTSISATYFGEQHLTIALEKRRTEYAVQVNDEQGPVEDALVLMYDYNRSIPSKEVFTDAAGRAGLGKIEEGNYTVKVSKFGYATEKIKENIDFQLDGDSTDTVIILSKTPQLEVETVSATGELLAEAEVTLYLEEEYNRPAGQPLHISYTNEDGEAVFDDVELEKNYVILVKKEGYLYQNIKTTLTEIDQTLKVEMGRYGEREN